MNADRSEDIGESDDDDMVFLTKDVNFNSDLYKHNENMRFGTRAPPDFQVVNFLGRGTVSLVWQVKNEIDD